MSARREHTLSVGWPRVIAREFDGEPRFLVQLVPGERECELSAIDAAWLRDALLRGLQWGLARVERLDEKLELTARAVAPAGLEPRRSP